MKDFTDYLQELIGEKEAPMPYAQNKAVTGQDELRDLPVAMAYVPFQKYEKSYDTNEALCKGTLFPELYKPFKGKFVKGDCAK